MAVVVCLFPGQGSQRVGMGQDLAAEFPAARRVFEEADQQPVRREETMRALATVAPDVALEVGPGKVLTGLLRRSAPDVVGVPAGHLADVARARELLA